MIRTVDTGMPPFNCREGERTMIKGLLFDLDGVLVDTAKYLSLIHI